MAVVDELRSTVLAQQQAETWRLSSPPRVVWTWPPGRVRVTARQERGGGGGARTQPVPYSVSLWAGESPTKPRMWLLSSLWLVSSTSRDCWLQYDVANCVTRDVITLDQFWLLNSMIVYTVVFVINQVRQNTQRFPIFIRKS